MPIGCSVTLRPCRWLGCICVISLAGPRTRLTAAKIHEHAALLREAASELAQLSNMAGFLSPPPLGKG